MKNRLTKILCITIIICSCNNYDYKNDIIGCWVPIPQKNIIDTFKFMSNMEYERHITLILRRDTSQKPQGSIQALKDSYFITGHQIERNSWKVYKDSLITYYHYTKSLDSGSKVYIGVTSNKYIIAGDKMILISRDGSREEWRKIK
ncbi:MAG TPA: hypothetical protein VN922_03135 [Bacteroidia bacterium]|nr:hypothetical protein [Bacteroidia bacterium]